ncbi:MAG TPA: LamG-like jellyroll fold domain-containing protein [Verrucomicrobiae bacterium]|jgi:hypothetical protein
MKIELFKTRGNAALKLFAMTMALLAVADSASAESWGIKFLGRTASPSFPVPDMVTGSAGVVPIPNWNNITNLTYTTGTIRSSDGLSTATLTISGTTKGQGGNGGWQSGSPNDGGDGSLADGYLDLGANIGGAETNIISGLTNASYTLYVYIYSDASHPGNGGDYLPNYSANGIVYYAPQYGSGGTTWNAAGVSIGGPFTGWRKSNASLVNYNTKIANTNDFGNYLEIDNVKPVNGVVTFVGQASNASWRSPLDGFELVADTTTIAPAITAQTPSLTNYDGTTIQLSVIASGTPLNYQWQAGAIGSGVYTNLSNVGNISGATDSTLTINSAVPSNMADYSVIVSNSLGSVTSSVPTTVSLIALAINSVSPAAAVLYPGGSATFNVSAIGAPPIVYQWQKIVGTTTNSIANATNSTLIITNVAAGDTALYGVVVSTPYATNLSPVIPLTVTGAPTDAYAQEILSLKPIAYWRLSEGSDTNAFDNFGSFTATYGPDAYLQDPGPSGPGFPVGNTSLSPENDDSQNLSSYATLAAGSGLQLNTNAATIVAWVRPAQDIPYAGILVQRDGSGVAGLGLGGNGDLGYNWNDSANTYNWDSGLLLPVSTWSMVVLVVTPTNATIYMYNTAQQSSATFVNAHAPAPFTGQLEIGSDSQDNELRAFSGDLGEVSVFNRALSDSEIVNLYTIGAGTPVAPSISLQPQSQWVYPGTSVQFNVSVTGSTPVTYQWQKDIGSGPQPIIGATNSSLIISNAGPSDVASYTVTAVNPVTSVTSVAATLSLLSASSFETNTLKLGPLGYWPLNETAGTNALDYSGNALHGFYLPGVAVGTTGPNPPFTGFGTQDNIAATFSGAADSYVSLPSFNVTSANMTFSAWIYPTISPQNGDAGLVVNRVNPASGFCFTDDGTQLSYVWNNDSTTWNYKSGLVPPVNQWSFVSLVVTPTTVTFYLYNTNTRSSFTGTHSQSPATFSGETRIADDNAGPREFTGQMAQVAVFNYALSPGQIAEVYTNGGVALPVLPTDANLTLAPQAGGGFQLNWSQGTLLESTNVTGPWTTNAAASPYTIPTTGSQKFYRIQLQ